MTEKSDDDCNDDDYNDEDSDEDYSDNIVRLTLIDVDAASFADAVSSVAFGAAATPRPVRVGAVTHIGWVAPPIIHQTFINVDATGDSDTVAGVTLVASAVS